MLERVPGIEPGYSAWKSTNFISIFNDRSDKSALTAPVEPKQLFWFVRTGGRARVASVWAAHAGKIDPTAAAVLASLPERMETLPPAEARLTEKHWATSDATSGKLEALEDTSSGEMALNCVQRATGLS